MILSYVDIERDEKRDDKREGLVRMRAARCEPCRWGLAFSVGVLLTLVFPAKWMLIVTLLLLIVLVAFDLCWIRG